VAIWIALIATVIAAWDEVKEELAHAGLLFPLSVLLIAVGLVAGARSWSVLQPVELRRRSMVGFLAAQPVKYLPVGGAMQAMGQVGLTTFEGASRTDVGWAFLIHAGVQVTAASFVGLLLLTDASAASWIKVAVVAMAAVYSLAVRKPVVAWIINRLVRLIPRIGASGYIPSTRTLWRSFGWTVVPVVLSGAAFAALLGLWDSPLAALSAMGAFAIAWVIGFLLFPLPSGLGAREAVLVALLPALPGAQVLGVSLIHRFSTFIAELILLAAVSRSAFVKSERSN
jgi:uncharacterized membrane protein YbhN (UPF0104 family)